LKKTIKISPFNRVEGDLEIKVELEDGKVREAYASGVMFRGFERLLKGRDPIDALVFTCRICGICSASHSAACSNALRDAFETKMPANAYLARNIILATEVLLNHLTHFYLFFAVDLVNKKYLGSSANRELTQRFTPFEGSSYSKVIKARANLLGVLGLFAGKWPNTLALQPGGTTRPVNLSEIIRAKGILVEFQNFLEQDLLGSRIERWLENKNLQDIDFWMGENDHQNSDLGFFIRSARRFGLDKIGKGPGKFLSSGGYHLPDGSTWLKSGYFDGEFKPFDEGKITEDIKYSWLKGYKGGRHPYEGVTEPDVDKPGAYSWAKSPRYSGNVVEVGPLARMINDRDCLVLDLVGDLGPSVYTRVLARLHEGVRLLKQLKIWLEEINPSQPFYIKPEKPKEAKGTGLTEAARGMLGHWITIEKGKIENYQVITPTTWNVSPRDSHGNPGAVEEALISTSVEDEKNPVEIAHIIRSYDPCLFCTVHVLKMNKQVVTFELTP